MLEETLGIDTNSDEQSEHLGYVHPRVTAIQYAGAEWADVDGVDGVTVLPIIASRRTYVLDSRVTPVCK